MGRTLRYQKWVVARLGYRGRSDGSGRKVSTSLRYERGGRGLVFGVAFALGLALGLALGAAFGCGLGLGFGLALTGLTFGFGTALGLGLAFTFAGEAFFT